MANARLRPVGHQSDDPLDEMLEDTFPASDPPSFTPVTGTGANEDAYEEFGTRPEQETNYSEHESRGGMPAKPMAALLGAIVTVVAIVFAVRTVRRRRHPDRREQIRHIAERAVTPVADLRKRVAA